MSERRYESALPATPAEVFDWHMRPGAFTRLAPPWQGVRVAAMDRPLRDGARATLILERGPWRVRWVARHEAVHTGRGFRDVQEKGPFGAWTHDHRFEDDGQGGARLIDRIEYRLPLEPLSRALAGRHVEREIDRVFRRRHTVTRNDLQRHAAYESKPLRVAISGGTGLIGAALGAYLATAGHDLFLLTRGGEHGSRDGDWPWKGTIAWSPSSGEVDRTALEGLDVVIHLAGAPIAVRWTDAARRRIRESRVEGTRLLAGALGSLERPPGVFLSASAIGWYGSGRDDVPRAERDPAGAGFLGEVAREWEAAAEAARTAGIRTVHPRFGIVLSSRGGALAKMLPAFRIGAGGPLGDGSQWFNWISLEDVLGAVEHLLHRSDLHGPVNLVAPGAVRQREFARVLGRVLNRPSFAPLPAAVVRTLFGEMGRETLLGGVPVEPGVLVESGFQFLHPHLEEALREELGRLRHGLFQRVG